MQKRTRKQLALVLTGAMAMSMMAGFGASAEESSSDIGEPNGGAEVTLWHYFEHEADALNKMVKQYNESQSDIYIVPTFVSREELMKQYTIGAVSGELPDIGMVDSRNRALNNNKRMVEEKRNRVRLYVQWLIGFDNQ